MAALPQVSTVEDALLRQMLVPGALRDELTRARNFYMLTTGAQLCHWSTCRCAFSRQGMHTSIVSHRISSGECNQGADQGARVPAS